MISFLATYLLHSTLLTLAALALSCFRVAKDPTLQNNLWKGVLLLPLLSSSLQLGAVLAPMPTHHPIATSETPIVILTEARPESRVVTPTEASPQVAAAPALLSTPTRKPLPVLSLLLSLWLAGFSLLGLRLVRSYLALRQLLGDRKTVEGQTLRVLETLQQEHHVKRPIRLSISARLKSPVAPWWHEICLPEQSLHLEPDALEVVLAHEVAHLARRDPWWLLLATLLETVLFFQPLQRLAKRRMQESAEYLCDDAATRSHRHSRTLAQCLLELARWQQESSYALVASMRGVSPLRKRIERLLHEERKPRRNFVTHSFCLGFCLLSLFAPTISPLGSAQAQHSALERDVWLTVVGRVSFSPNSVQHVDLESYAIIETRDLTLNRRLEIRRGANGTPEFSYQQNGNPAPFDAQAHRWLQEVLELSLPEFLARYEQMDTLQRVSIQRGYNRLSILTIPLRERGLVSWGLSAPTPDVNAPSRLQHYYSHGLIGELQFRDDLAALLRREEHQEVAVAALRASLDIRNARDRADFLQTVVPYLPDALPVLEAYFRVLENLPDTLRPDALEPLLPQRQAVTEGELILLQPPITHVELELNEDVTVSDDERSIAHISEGGSFILTIGQGSFVRRVEAYPAEDGSVRYHYSLNGEAQDPADGQALLAEALPGILQLWVYNPTHLNFAFPKTRPFAGASYRYNHSTLGNARGLITPRPQRFPRL